MAQPRTAEQLFSLSRAMIRQARILKDAGSEKEAKALAERARALSSLSWSYRAAA